MDDFDEVRPGKVNGVKPSDKAPEVPEWARKLWGQLAVAFCTYTAWLVMLTLAVTIGTALGNGVPMARSASTAFQAGFQTGIKNCPCAQKGPTPINQPMVPKPTGEGQKLTVKGGIPTIEAKAEPVKTALFESLKPVAETKEKPVDDVKESVIPSRRTEPSKVFESK